MVKDQKTKSSLLFNWTQKILGRNAREGRGGVVEGEEEGIEKALSTLKLGTQDNLSRGTLVGGFYGKRVGCDRGKRVGKKARGRGGRGISFRPRGSSHEKRGGNRKKGGKGIETTSFMGIEGEEIENKKGIVELLYENLAQVTNSGTLKAFRRSEWGDGEEQPLKDSPPTLHYPGCKRAG